MILGAGAGLSSEEVGIGAIGSEDWLKQISGSSGMTKARRYFGLRTCGIALHFT